MSTAARARISKGMKARWARVKAQKAVEAMNGKSLDGRALTVNIARPREERSGGGGRPQYGSQNPY